ncbi:TetR/AcrR family transcriptional regulator C-terminal domain-containing protein [Granulicella arctica]|uniref:TetR/AcrR family transcriptional regulator C-terminal domain-containing protein n=1 Tax=Granulicella arctica TaxID=940613 RepID=UPI0021DF9A42|nr:TetR/AcrR family transcriptional regulator C-terminal domain-containing protein [Granulicella arctica]
MKVNPELIVRAGLTLLNEIGLEQLTLRRLAMDLNIQAPTLYWHFKSKEQLIDAMATLILAEGVPALLPRKKSADWRSWATTFGHGLRQILLHYRDGARVVAGSRLTDTTYMEATERIGTRLIEAGFSTRNAVVLLSTVYTFTVSFVLEEQAVFPTRGQRSPAYNLAERNARLDPEKFPLMRQSATILFDRFDQRYKESLKLILGGAAETRIP